MATHGKGLHPENEALLAWLREVLAVQTHDGVCVLSDGKTESGVYLRGDSICLIGGDDEETVIAKVRLVPA